MKRATVAILGMCGLMGAWTSVQAQSEMMVAEELPPVQPVADKGAGLHYGPLQVLPELDVSYFHDTNPTYAPHDSKGVNGLRAEPMLDLILNGNGWNAFARGWVAKDWYLGSVDASEKNVVPKEQYGESAGVTYTTPQDTKLSVTESYMYWNGDSFVQGASGGNAADGSRALFNGGAVLDTRLGEKTGMSVGASYSDLWYDRQDLYGRKDVGETLGFSRKISDKTDALLDFGADEQTSDGGSDGGSQCYRVLVGIGSKLTEKTSYRAEVGLMEYEFDDGSKSAVAPTYNLSANWAISDRLSANASGSATYQTSETDQHNYTLVDTFSAGLAFKATSRLTTTLNAIYRREDYAETDLIANEKRRDNEVDLAARATYQLFRYTSVFVGAEYGKNKSSINTPAEDFNYNRLFVETGVNLHF